MGLCLCIERQAQQNVPSLDLTSVTREEEIFVPYQDDWIEGKLTEVVSGNTILAVVDFGVPVTMRLKIRGCLDSDASPDRVRKELQERLPTNIKVKPISWEREGKELLVEVKRRSSDSK